MDFLWILLIIIFSAIIVGGLIIFALIYLTTGFKNTGRMTGGLYTIRGKPGAGKTYFATHLGVEALKEGKRRVFSNYPILYSDGEKTLCSLFFQANMILDKNLNGAIIINDESHMDFWSRDFKNFDKQKKDFFSHCSQHGISFYSIVQHEDRQDTIINDCTNLFAVVDKLEIPFLEIPICFYIEWWADEEEMKNAKYHPDLMPFHTERVWFKKEVAMAYDTRFFGHDKRPIYEGVTWVEYKKKKDNEDIIPSDDYSKITMAKLLVKKQLNTIYDKILSVMPKKRLYGDIGDRIDRSLEEEADTTIESLFEDQKEEKNNGSNDDD